MTGGRGTFVPLNWIGAMADREHGRVVIVLDDEQTVRGLLPSDDGAWQELNDAADEVWGGPR